MIPVRFDKGALHALIVIAIVCAAGPEYFAALDVILVLELLGTTLFLIAYSAAVKHLLREISRVILNLLVPLEHRTLLRARVPLAAKCHTLGVLLLNGVVWLCLTICFGVFLHTLPALLA